VRKRATDMMDLVGLSQAMNKKAGTYSRGMKQRLGLAEVLIKQPEVIIMDEPTLGIDPAGVAAFLSLIRQLSNQQNITVLLSSHHLNQVQQVCDRVGIFVEGRLLASDHIARLSNHLFSRDAHVVKITFDERISNADEYQAGLMNIEGVTGVTAGENTIEVSGTRNATPEFVRYFVQKGLNIMGVHQKEYGLEEIYQRYFENNLTEKETNGKSGNLFQRSIFKKIKK
jgi:ABC-2 type transport system ATP-binding protein